MNLIETSRQLVGFDSTPSRGTREIAEFVAQLCREAKLAVETDAEILNGIEQMNLLARPSGAPNGEEVMLQTHLDTVDPGNFGAWTRTQANPFNASIHQDRLYGLGVADTKLDFLCKLEALGRLGSRAWRRRPVLVGTYGAQAGMIGAIKLMRRKRVKARWAMVGEPTELRIGHAGQGLAVVEIRIPFSEDEIRYRQMHDMLESGSTQSKLFKGRAAHSSDPSLGDNAIVKMLDYLAQLPSGIAIMDLDGGNSYNTVPESAVLEIDVVGSLRDPIVGKLGKIAAGLRRMERKLAEFPAPGFQPPHPTLNIGTIRTRADHVLLSGSCRLTPNVGESDYQEWIAAISEDCAAVGAEFLVTDYKPAFTTPGDAPIAVAAIRSAQATGLATDLIQVPASTEANVFTRFGLECLVFGPGRGAGNSHAPNESIRIDELNRAVDFYQVLIKELCL